MCPKSSIDEQLNYTALRFQQTRLKTIERKTLDDPNLVSNNKTDLSPSHQYANFLPSL